MNQPENTVIERLAYSLAFTCNQSRRQGEALGAYPQRKLQAAQNEL